MTFQTKHGLRRHALYTVWQNMKSRCYNLNASAFKNYGARGITVCDEWRNDFQAFYDWATTHGWKRGLHIDRVDNDGNYEPGNCRFVTVRDNMLNRRKKSKLPPGVVATRPGKYSAKILLGTFDNPADASALYKRARHALAEIL